MKDSVYLPLESFVNIFRKTIDDVAAKKKLPSKFNFRFVRGIEFFDEFPIVGTVFRL